MATWEPPSRSLKVVTTNVHAGYLRRNGVPYSENAVLTEYFELAPLPNGGQLLLVTAIVDDPRYLQTPFIVTSQFKKRSRRLKMGSNAMLDKLLNTRLVCAACVLLCVALAAPAFAQFELAGSWAARNHEFLAGDGLPVDFTGIPMNEEGRTRALSYSESQLAMTERQCQGWPAFYFVQGPFGLKIWSNADPRERRGYFLDDRSVGRSRAADDLDGRTAASVEVCRTHSSGIHNRDVGKETSLLLIRLICKPAFCGKRVLPAAIRPQ